MRGMIRQWQSARLARRACEHGEVRDRKLNLGCGQRSHPDWTNVDFNAAASGVIRWNLRKGLPFDNETFGVLYHSHVLEHFSKRYAITFMEECFRVLCHGGIVRVVVPDLEQIARCYLKTMEGALENSEQDKSRYEWVILELLDQMVRNRSGGEMFDYWLQDPMPQKDFVVERCGSEVTTALEWLKNPANVATVKRAPENDENPLRIGRFRLSGEVHQWMYDRYSLRLLLQRVGFADIHVCDADESSISNFNSYHLDIERDGSVRKPESLFMEARKP